VRCTPTFAHREPHPARSPHLAPVGPGLLLIPPLRAGTVAAVLGAGGPAGGPSRRRVEQANEYFERCFAADRDVRRSDSERRACWTAWHEHYEVGQPDDRIDYVRERLVMLDPARGSVIELATAEVEESEPGSVEPGAAEAVEAEAAPPEGPELSSLLEGQPTVRQRRRPVAPRVRTSACAAACEPDFVTCANGCEIADRGCTDACRHRFRQCSRGCF